jgi:hypothetical protein
MRAAAGGGLAITFCFIGLVRRASADCEPHCSYPCGELNGPLNLECGDCTAASGFRFSSMSVHYLVLTLNTTTRRHWVHDLRRTLPNLEVYLAVNGFDERATLRALAQCSLKYHINSYCGFSRFGTYGSLSCFLTKVLALTSQVARELPFMAMLEDDMRLKPDFPAFVEQAVQKHFVTSASPPEILVLGDWGEGYVTSLESARRVLASLRHQGVPLNVDIMLNAGHAGRALKVHGTPWVHRIAPNLGDIQSTPHVRREVLIRNGLTAPLSCTSGALGRHRADGNACMKDSQAARTRYCRGVKT